jgi:hypothetical protein
MHELRAVFWSSSAVAAIAIVLILAIDAKSAHIFVA